MHTPKLYLKQGSFFVQKQKVPMDSNKGISQKHCNLKDIGFLIYDNILWFIYSILQHLQAYEAQK